MNFCAGPSAAVRAISISQIGDALNFNNPLTVNDDWTACWWTLFIGGKPCRPGFVQPPMYREGEHCMFAKNAADDDQPVFYSEQRGYRLGAWALGSNHPDAVQGFVASEIDFRDVSDGWHHVAVVGAGGRTTYSVDDACAHISVGGPHTIRTVGNVGSIEDYTQPWGLVADLRIFRDRALGRQELKAIRRGVEATLPAAPAASDLVAPYDLTPGREYNAPPGPPGDY